MLAGADSIDDLDVLRHGGMAHLFGGVRAPSTVGSFLRAFTFGHVRQLDAVAARRLVGLASEVPGLLAGADGPVFLDIDDTVKPVFGASKQGAQHGYTRIKGLNAQLATLSTSQAAPVIAATRLRRGAAAFAHGAVRLLRDAIRTACRAGVTGPILVRADSAYYQHGVVTAALRAGAQVSLGARQDTAVRRAIAGIGEATWTKIAYPQAVLDPDTGALVSVAEVAETRYTAFTSHGRNAVAGRLLVRRVPERNRDKLAPAAQQGLFTVWRYHAIFTTSQTPLVEAESTHRGHAIIEQTIADLKAGPLALLSCRPVHRERRLAGRRHHRPHPHPRGRGPRRGKVPTGRDCHRARQTPHRPSPPRPLRPASPAAPAATLALGAALATTLDCGHDHLTKQTPDPTTRGTRRSRPTGRVRTPTPATHPQPPQTASTGDTQPLTSVD